MPNWLNNCINWANRGINEQTIDKFTVTTQAGRGAILFPSFCLLSCCLRLNFPAESNHPENRICNRTPEVVREGGKVNSRARESWERTRESWFLERKEKLAAIRSLWVWLTAAYRLMAQTCLGVTCSMVAWKVPDMSYYIAGWVWYAIY